MISPYVVAELDHLVTTRYGEQVELRVLNALTGEAWDLVHFGRTDVRAALEVISRYPDQAIGLADASLVVLAARYGTDRILTLDRRHFSILRTAADTPFTVLPS